MKKVAELLKEHFGIEDATLKKLEGYGRSINYQVDPAQGEKFVYKHYQTEPGLYELLDAENQFLQKLSHQSPNSYPAPVRNRKGKFLSSIDDGKQLGRLLTFVEGEFLAEVEHSTGLFQSIGRFLAQMNKTLLDFRHPAIEARQLDWTCGIALTIKNISSTLKHRNSENWSIISSSSLVKLFFLRYRI